MNHSRAPPDGVHPSFVSSDTWRFMSARAISPGTVRCPYSGIQMAKACRIHCSSRHAGPSAFLSLASPMTSSSTADSSALKWGGKVIEPLSSSPSFRSRVTMPAVST